MESGIEVAEKAISDGSKKINEHLTANVLDPEKLQSDNQMIRMDLLRKKLYEELSSLIEKRKAKLHLNK